VAEGEQKLVWPPTKEDLERLYLHEHLSAMKIAIVYGLKYPSPKTAESTILHHLKKNGIGRRDCAEHVRKVTAEMVDDWVKRYQAGESLKQIAGEEVDHVTVFLHLHKRGLQLRDKVEAQIKAVTRFQKTPFDGTEEDRAYLLGFTRGDLNVARHGRSIRVKTSSTHPAMIELVTYLFAPYGPVRIYPHYTDLAGYEWTVEGELDRTFEFLLIEKMNNLGNGVSRRVAMAYLAGLFDAEGSVWIRVAGKRTPEISIPNTDASMLDWVKSCLTSAGFTPQRGSPNSDGVAKVRMWRENEITSLLRLMPLRHPEKKARARLLLDAKTPWNEIEKKWRSLLKEFEEDRLSFIALAKHAWMSRRAGII